MSDVLDRASAGIERELGDRPLIAARLHHTIGMTYQSLGRYASAEQHLDEALQTRRRVLGDEHPATLTSMDGAAQLLLAQGLFDQAEPVFTDTLAHRRRVLGREHADTLESESNLASL